MGIWKRPVQLVFVVAEERDSSQGRLTGSKQLGSVSQARKVMGYSR